jgi:serine/threonine-protein kinase
VRIARQVSHPNVCRVYDLGEADGHHFLSMEFVDGDDLASLLKKVGRLPGERAVSIARQLCAGLHAAHEQGILHRDLKPHNVMIDPDGRVRITDFGLAGLADGIAGAEILSGTPQFMAPEQLSGRSVSTASDIYSLGLVLYEMFTGQRAYEGKTRAEVVQRQHETTPASPSELVENFDPAVQRVIFQCLDHDPASRPPSALAVAAALPGGDPVAAALAAGETPSPEMIARSGGQGALAPRAAVPALLFTLIVLGFAALLLGRVGMLGVLAPELPPQVLADRARQIVQRLGYEETPRDAHYGFFSNRALVQRAKEGDDSPDRWDRLRTERPSPLTFWYRQSPRALVPQNDFGRVSFSEPPMRISGMTQVSVDPSGRLGFLKAVPPQFDDEPEPGPDPDWRTAFELAELELDAFTPAAPHWIAEVHSDARAAWTGHYPEQPDLEVRIEAASYRGRLVYFDLIHPWERPWRMEESEAASDRAVGVIFGVIFACVLVGSVLLARRNLALGRGDRRGGFVAAGAVLTVYTLGWAFQASHQARFDRELNLFILWMGQALFDAVMVWIMYVALEPFARRRWPTLLVSWSRLLSGRVRDPLVGKHLLVGSAFGASMLLLGVFSNELPGLMGWPPVAPPAMDWDSLVGTRFAIGELFFGLRHTIVNPMILLMLLVVMRVVVRNRWVATGIVVLVFTAAGSADADYPTLQIPIEIAKWAVILTGMLRFGLVGLMAAYFVGNELSEHALTLDFSTWYAGNSMIVLLIPAAIAVYGFWTSLAGRSVFAED